MECLKYYRAQDPNCHNYRNTSPIRQRPIKWITPLNYKNDSLIMPVSYKWGNTVLIKNSNYLWSNLPFSSFFSISTRRSTPSMTSCTRSTSDLPSLSRLEMSNVPSLEAVSTPPVPLFCRRHFSRMSLNLQNSKMYENDMKWNPKHKALWTN